MKHRGRVWGWIEALSESQLAQAQSLRFAKRCCGGHFLPWERCWVGLRLSQYAVWMIRWLKSSLCTLPNALWWVTFPLSELLRWALRLSLATLWTPRWCTSRLCVLLKDTLMDISLSLSQVFRLALRLICYLNVWWHKYSTCAFLK